MQKKGELNSGYLFVHEIEKSLCSGSSGIAPARPLNLSKRVRHGNRRKFRLRHKNNWQDATSCLFFYAFRGTTLSLMSLRAMSGLDDFCYAGLSPTASFSGLGFCAA